MAMVMLVMKMMLMVTMMMRMMMIVKTADFIIGMMMALVLR